MMYIIYDTLVITPNSPAFLNRPISLVTLFLPFFIANVANTPNSHILPN